MRAAILLIDVDEQSTNEASIGCFIVLVSNFCFNDDMARVWVCRALIKGIRY